MNTFHSGISGLRAGFVSGGLALAAALALASAPSSAQAQSGSERYLPERTRADYGDAGVSEDGYDYAAQTLRVSIWLDRDEEDIYRRGDEQRVVFQTNEDAYAVVYRIDTDGLVSVLWPRDRLDDGFVFGGHEYRLPGREAPALRIDESEGEGYVQAVVSRYPFDLRALELDFLGEGERDRYGFRVAGDPFLAMNEVNFAITGLEDSRDHVITNHARYYVHRVVDHPRYLCSQCHDSDSPRYDPYAGSCTLDIDYDYGWGNRWYATYGYYPVYWNPVYVYVDPWTWRPWVNFWYDPWYTCAPWQGWRGAYWGCYTWNDSPYYRGGCWTRWDGGDRRYRPLNRHGDTVAVRKARDYDQVTRQVVRARPDESERGAMIARRPVRPRDEGRGVTRERGTGDVPVALARGDKPAARTVERFPANPGSSRGGALRIRPGSGGDPAAAADKPAQRHTAGGGERAPSLQPVRPARPARGADGDAIRGGAPAREQDREGVRTLTPRQQGTRVWNGGNGRDAQAPDRAVRPERPERRVRDEASGQERGRDAGPAPTPRREGVERSRRGSEEGRVQPGTGSERRESPARPGGGRRDDGAPARQPDAPRSVRETQRPARESAPAPARQEPPRRAEPDRGRDGGKQDDGKARDSGGSRPAEAPARRAPAEGRR